MSVKAYLIDKGIKAISMKISSGVSLQEPGVSSTVLVCVIDDKDGEEHVEHPITTTSLVRIKNQWIA